MYVEFVFWFRKQRRVWKGLSALFVTLCYARVLFVCSEAPFMRDIVAKFTRFFICNYYFIPNYYFITLYLSNTSNKLIQLATQHYWVASWKALLHVLLPTSNIVTQQNFVVASWSSMLQQIELASTFFNKFFQLAIMLRCKLKENVARITGPLERLVKNCSG